MIAEFSMRSAARREAGRGVTPLMVFLVLAVALMVRLLHLRYALNSPLTYQPGPDEDFYFRFGKAVAECQVLKRKRKNVRVAV